MIRCCGGVLVVMRCCGDYMVMWWRYSGVLVVIYFCFGDVVLLIMIEKISVVTELLNKVEYKRKSTKYIYRAS